MDTEVGRYQASKQTKTRQQFKYRGEVGMKCPHCGETVNPHMELCPACGCPLHADHCTFCGAPMIPGEKFCSECGNAVGGIIIAYATILVLGASFSLVPASLWPSVPKLVDAKVIGSAYALIFWIQNIGLWLFPLLIGKVLDATNPGVTDPTQFDYTAPLVMLACLGVAALILGFILKAVDKKKGIGLELPNITK